jgi:transposase
MALDRIIQLTEERRAILADLESVTGDLRRALVEAITSGELTEKGAHRLTGVSRSTVRDWLGKGKT